MCTIPVKLVVVFCLLLNNERSFGGSPQSKVAHINRIIPWTLQAALQQRSSSWISKIIVSSTLFLQMQCFLVHTFVHQHYKRLILLQCTYLGICFTLIFMFRIITMNEYIVSWHHPTSVCIISEWLVFVVSWPHSYFSIKALERGV